MQQREIKFKAWNKKYKFMYDNIVTFPAEDCNFYYEVSRHPGSYHLPSGRSDLADIIVLQYTGYEDKNSKEIYEGDIVKVNLNEDDDQEEWIEAQVVFEDGAFKALSQSFSLPLDSICEVIGTIYENPELLK